MMNRHQQLGQALTPRLRRRGFSLLELSVVLGIISLIAGAGVSMASGALKTADRIATQEKLATIKLALDSHARIYGYLPCPADRALAPTSANFGVEKRGATSNTGAPCTNLPNSAPNPYFNTGTIAVGGVPVRTLGLPDSYASDSWGNKLSYTVTSVIADEPSRYSTKNGNVYIKYKSSGAPYSLNSQRSSGTYTSVTAGGDASFTFTPVLPQNTIVHFKPNVAGGYNGSYWVKLNNTTPTKLTTDGAGTTTYLAFNGTDTGGTVEWQEDNKAGSYAVVSHGPDGLGAYPTESATVLKTCALATTIDGENCDEDADFHDADYNDGAVAAQYFDDFIVWGSSSLARTAVNDGVYTSGTTSACPTGVCEPWCAACTSNFPQTTPGTVVTTVPPPLLVSATATDPKPILCKKVLSSSATTCTATCFWGGLNTTPNPDQYQKCP